MKEPNPHGYQIESAWSLAVLSELLRRWRARASAEDSEVRRGQEVLISELEAVLQRTLDESISIEQLASFSGNSVRLIRDYVEGGLVPDLGEVGRRRVRRREFFASADALAESLGLFDALLDETMESG